MRKKSKATAAVLAVIAVSVGAAAWWSFVTVDTGALGSGAADALIVFGSPADLDGTVSRMQAWRVDEAVAEYRRGVAAHIIFTGGPAANRFVEAEVMAQAAEAAGVPASAILTEGHSLTTVENLRGVSAIMRAHGWATAELISSPDHLPRIAVIARPAPFRWRLHAAPTPGRGRLHSAWADVEESAATLLLRSFGSAAEPVVHAIAICEHWLFYVPKWIIWKLRQHGTPRPTPPHVPKAR